MVYYFYFIKKSNKYYLILWNVELPIIDSVNEVVRCSAVDGAADGLGSPKNFLHGTLQLLGH